MEQAGWEGEAVLEPSPTALSLHADLHGGLQVCGEQQKCLKATFATQFVKSQ